MATPYDDCRMDAFPPVVPVHRVLYWGALSDLFSRTWPTSAGSQPRVRIRPGSRWESYSALALCCRTRSGSRCAPRLPRRPREARRCERRAARRRWRDRARRPCARPVALTSARSLTSRRQRAALLGAAPGERGSRWRHEIAGSISAARGDPPGYSGRPLSLDRYGSPTYLTSSDAVSSARLLLGPSADRHCRERTARRCNNEQKRLPTKLTRHRGR